MHRIVALSILFFMGLVNASPAEDFALRDGDTVVFLGDSITAARVYSRLVENYTLLRFPNRRIHFINAGIGGDTAAGGLARIDRDVFANKATVLLVAYGINDIGWGTRGDAEHKQRYLDSISEIVRRSKERGVRVYICSAAITGHDPAKTENDFLQTMCEEGMAIARKQGEHSIDVQGTMREILKQVWKSNESINDPAKKESMHHPDGVHLNELGQTAMAYAILKGLNAPAEVSSVTIDANTRKLVTSNGCKITDIAGTPQKIEFTRLDEGLPLNAQTFFALHFRFVPIHTELNQYLVQINSLSPGSYDIVVDGNKIANYSAEDLAKGVNISSSTIDPWQPGGPWDAQANILHALTESRDRLESSISAPMIAVTEKAEFPKQFRSEVLKANTQLEEIQRLAAKPHPYHFVVQRSDSAVSPKSGTN